MALKMIEGSGFIVFNKGQPKNDCKFNILYFL